MKFLLLAVMSLSLSLAHAGYQPPPLTGDSNESHTVNTVIEKIFSDKVTAEASYNSYFDLFRAVNKYLCWNGKIVYNDTDLLKFIKELNTHHPFNRMKFEALAGNIHRQVGSFLSDCRGKANESTYSFLQKNNFYVATEMPVVGIGSNAESKPFDFLNLAELKEVKPESFGLVINQKQTPQVWGERRVEVLAINHLEINKNGNLLQTLLVPSIADYNFPQIKHVGLSEDIKSIQLYKHLRRLAMVVYNSENVVSIWTTDIEKLNEWKLVGVASPSLSLDARLAEVKDGFNGDILAGFWATTSKLGIDHQGKVYIVSQCGDGEYRPGAWKVHRIDNF